jgi:hypothetical protein
MVRKMMKPAFEPYLWGGVKGGIIGGILLVALAGAYWIYSGTTEGLASMLFIGFALAPMGGAITGLVVG